MAGTDVALTRATRGVLAELIADPAAAQYVTQLHSATGLSAGQIYGVLARLEAVRWLESGWDAPTSKQQGWPRRRHYRLSSDGLAMARGALASASSIGRLRPATGSA
jgi:DNA-binding PadR family transcriptional regulator